MNGEKTIKEGTGGSCFLVQLLVSVKTGEVLFLCIDGRQGHSLGTDLDVLQNTLYDEGCCGCPLSTVMYYKDDYVNKPSLRP